MNNRRNLLAIILILVVIIFGITTTVLGQGDMCPILVERALAEVGNNCAGLGRNAACYGFNRVNATFFEAMDEGFFSTPADRADLPLIQSLETAPLNVAESEWGVALMNVQANLPGTLPGQGVTFLLMGDVAIENEVEPQAALTFEPVRVLTLENMNLRTRPTANSNILDTITMGTELLTDGIDSDGEWLRVTYNDTVAWLSKRYVTVDADLASLPVVDNPPPTAMQAIRLRTGITGVNCEETPPSALVIQSPQHLVVDITVNGVEMRIGSTIFYRNVEVNGQLMMQIGVIDGSVVFEDGTTLPTGFAGFIPLNEDGSASGGLTNLRPMNADELADMHPLENFPAGLLSYEISVPTEEEVAQIAALVGGNTSETASQPITTPEVTQIPVVVSNVQMQPDTGAAPVTPASPPVAGLNAPSATPTVPPTATATSTPTATPPTGNLALNLGAPCVANIMDDRSFTISNPNNFTVTVTWSAGGSGGSSSISANGTLSISGINSNGNNHLTLTANWGFGSGSFDSCVC
jgi:Bacterial SH3 domain